MRLVKPTVELKEQYLEMLEEWKQSGEEMVPWPLKEDPSDFQTMVSRVEGYSRGIGVKEGFVPSSTYWLVGDDDMVLGAINIRHELNDSLRYKNGNIGYGVRPGERRKGYATLMLRMTLDIVREMGMESVMISCNKENIASAGTIINNGGILDSEDVDEEGVFQRYWIHLSPAPKAR